MPFDPTKPAPSSPILASELRNQFNGLQQNIQAKASEDECVSRFSLCAPKPTPVEGLGMVVSDPPTQEQMQQIANKLDELLSFLKGP